MANARRKKNLFMAIRVKRAVNIQMNQIEVK